MHPHIEHPRATPRQGRHRWSQWRIAWSVAIVTGLGFIMLSPSAAQARTFNCRAGDVGCLITSIMQANAQPGQSHEIRLAAGVYTLTQVHNTIDGANGLPSITSHLTIRGAEAELTTIARNDNTPAFRLIHVAATGALTLDGVMLTGGASDGGSGASWSWAGGGLLNQGGALVLTNTVVTHNMAVDGGGLYTVGGSVTIRQTLFMENLGTHGSGGGLFGDGGTITIAQSAFVGNVAFVGGGLCLDGGTMTVTNTTIRQNMVGVFGGGLHLSTGQLTIMDSTVTDNMAVDEGGGLSVGSGQLTMTNSTVTQNSGGALGGGLVLDAPTRLVNVTVADNIAQFGGGIASFASSVELQNTILARNYAYYGEPFPPDCWGLLTSLGDNLLGDLTGCTLTPVASDVIGESGLANFINDGQPGHGYIPLLSTSRAVNAGNDAVCPKKDQLGEKRVGICDIGSIEFQGTAVSSR